MQQLTPQQLGFIDTYLKKSGVQYDDIRHEMTDHVASAIEAKEGDFKENFYSYMINHKRELLDSNAAYKKLAFSKAVSLITQNLTKVQFYLIALFIFATACLAGYISGKEIIADDLHLALVVLSSVIIINFWGYKIFSKSSYSVIDKLVMVVYLGAVFIRIDKFIKDNTLLSLYYSFAIAFFILLMQSLYKLKKQYKLRYGA